LVSIYNVFCFLFNIEWKISSHLKILLNLKGAQ
jgi:hypothetical protein